MSANEGMDICGIVTKAADMSDRSWNLTAKNMNTLMNNIDEPPMHSWTSAASLPNHREVDARSRPSLTPVISVWMTDFAMTFLLN